MLLDRHIYSCNLPDPCFESLLSRTQRPQDSILLSSESLSSLSVPVALVLFIPEQRSPSSPRATPTETTAPNRFLARRTRSHQTLTSTHATIPLESCDLKSTRLSQAEFTETEFDAVALQSTALRTASGLAQKYNHFIQTRCASAQHSEP
jgi:uncharacterized protein YjbI with pentapeptide repeats